MGFSGGLGSTVLLDVLARNYFPQKQTQAAEKGKGGVHPTLIVLLVAWVPLIVRGVFGVLQAVDYSLSYYNRKFPLPIRRSSSI